MGKPNDLILLYPKQNGVPVLLRFLCKGRHSPILKDVSFIPVNEKFHPQPELKLTPRGGFKIQGIFPIAKCLARLDPILYAHFDPYDSAIIDHWLESLQYCDTSDEAHLALFKQADTHLHERQSFAGDPFSVADFAFWIYLNDYVNNHPDFDLLMFPNLCRWYDFCYNDAHFVPLKELVALQAENLIATTLSVSEPSSSSSSSTTHRAISPSSLGKVQTGFKTKQLSLPGVKYGEVVTRFPPEPSGFMHLGHCKAAFVNFLTAQKYAGKMLLRFDDTNPAAAKQVYVDAFIQDLADLQISYCQLTYTSDYFDLLIEWCEKMLTEGHFYVDQSTDEEIQAQRADLATSPYRDSSIAENLERWKAMVNGEDNSSVVRAKIDPAHPVGCLRDPNMFRTSSHPHYRTGNKFHVYPLYDFACPIIDSLEGVTHAFRSNEYHDRNALYAWMFEKTKLRPVYLLDFARLNLSYTLLSKRKLNWFVQNKLVDGWDHPSFPSIRALFRRGMTVEALREFILRQGITSNSVLIDTNDLWSLNRQRLEPVVPRYTCIAERDCYTMRLINFDREATPSQLVPVNPKDVSSGLRSIQLSNHLYIENADGQRMSTGMRIGLLNWSVAVVELVDHQTRVIHAELNLQDTDFSSAVKVTWLSVLKDPPLTALLKDYKPLISKPFLQKANPHKNIAADRLEDIANRDLETTQHVFVEDDVLSLTKGSRIQFWRRGYYILDSRPRDAHHPVFIRIPEGRLKSMSSIPLT
jgi:glutamyl/glutaminyl-tRNA synthetase